MMDKENQQSFSLEKSLEEIKQIVVRMQKGVDDFDEQISLFTRGNDLIKECQTFLDGAEWKIEQLIHGEKLPFESSEELDG